jgi:hypothetical protein
MYYQNIFFATKIHSIISAGGEYVEIGGVTYFMDLGQNVYRDEAQALCESKGMNIVKLDASLKFDSVHTWFKSI